MKRPETCRWCDAAPIYLVLDKSSDCLTGLCEIHRTYASTLGCFEGGRYSIVRLDAVEWELARILDAVRGKEET